MPGFFEHDQWENDVENCDDVEMEEVRQSKPGAMGDDSKANVLAGPSRPPHSKPKSSREPKIRDEALPDSTGGSTQVCPICARELEVDNAGLNEHIDFCLSKGAIMAATSTVSSTSKDRQAPHSKKRKKK